METLTDCVVWPVSEGDCKNGLLGVQTGLIILACVAGVLVIVLACFLCYEQVKRT